MGSYLKIILKHIESEYVKQGKWSRPFSFVSSFLFKSRKSTSKCVG